MAKTYLLTYLLTYFYPIDGKIAMEKSHFLTIRDKSKRIFFKAYVTPYFLSITQISIGQYTD